MHPLSALIIIGIIPSTINSISCSGKDICQCSGLNTGDTCHLNCIVDNGCDGTTLLCSDGDPCWVRCNGLNSCKDAIIYGVSAIDITLICWGGDYACNAVDIIPQQATDVTISCGANINAGCTNSNFTCGSGECTIDCPNADSCNGVIIDSSLSPTFTCTGSGCLNITTSIPSTSMPTTAIPTVSIPFIYTTTENPTAADVYECDKEFSVSIQFGFVVHNSLSDKEIKNIVQNITETFINKEIQCNLYSQYNSEIILNGTDNAIIDLLICDDCKDDVVTINNFNANELQKHFIEIFKDTTDILFVIANSTKISVYMQPKDGVIPETTMSGKTTIDANKINANDDIFWSVMGPLMAVIIICVICLFVFIVHKMKMIKNEMKGNQQMIDFVTPGIQISTMDTSTCHSPVNITSTHSNGFVTEQISSVSDINDDNHDEEEEDDIDTVPNVTGTTGGEESCDNDINIITDDFIVTEDNNNEGPPITPGYTPDDDNINDDKTETP